MKKDGLDIGICDDVRNDWLARELREKTTTAAWTMAAHTPRAAPTTAAGPLKTPRVRAIGNAPGTKSGISENRRSKGPESR